MPTLPCRSAPKPYLLSVEKEMFVIKVQVSISHVENMTADRMVVDAILFYVLQTARLLKNRAS